MTRTVEGRVRPTSSPILAIVAALLAGACTAGAAPDAPPPGAPQSGDALTAEGLPGTEWVLVRLHGAPPLPMPPVTLAFTDSTYGGYGGCNWFGGRYVAGADTLRTVGEISSTLRGCAGPIGDQEQRYVNTLRDVRGFRHAADTLRLHGGDRRTVLELVRRRLRAMDPARLQGTRWRLVAMGDSVPPQGARITLAFQGDSLRGHAGCRDFTGTYNATGHRFHMTSMAMVQMECGDERRLLEEGAFTGALSETRDYQLEGDTLLLLPVSGQVLRFTRDTSATSP
jgi:heat shock protein HslJ